VLPRRQYFGTSVGNLLTRTVFWIDFVCRIGNSHVRDPPLLSDLTECCTRTQVCTGLAVPLTATDILVVEDDSALREMLVRLFTSEGFSAREASDGKEALRLVNESTPHLIVLDLMLPFVNGIEVLATVRHQPHLLHVPVLVITGTATSAFDLRGFGLLRVMRKPLDVDAVIPAVRTLLDVSATLSVPLPHEERAMSEAREAAPFEGLPTDEQELEAEYTLESPVRCPACGERTNSFKAIRLIRAQVNFTSTLPRRGRLLACPHCLAVIPGELTNF
jgi:DNA-binding response OmpR family regulator